MTLSRNAAEDWSLHTVLHGSVRYYYARSLSKIQPRIKLCELKNQPFVRKTYQLIPTLCREKNTKCFSKYKTLTIRVKFGVTAKTYKRFPPQLNSVSTLPC